MTLETNTTAVLTFLGLVSLFTDIILVTPASRSWAKVLILCLMIGVSGLLRFWQEFRFFARCLPFGNKVNIGDTRGRRALSS